MINDDNIITRLESVLTALYIAMDQSSIKEIEKTAEQLAEFKKIVSKKKIEADTNANNKPGIFHVLDYSMLMRTINTIKEMLEITLDNINTKQLMGNYE
jgi:hypothetical protein